MKGGMKQYLVTNRDYGSGFDDLLMESILVYSMLVEKHDNLPLGLAHDGCALYCHLGFNHFEFAQRDGHGGDLHIVRYGRMNL